MFKFFKMFWVKDNKLKNKELYLTPQEEGLSPQSSHPNYRAVIKEAFFYSSGDEFSPFGNDDGSMTLDALEEWYRQNQRHGDVIAFLFERLESFGFEEDYRKLIKVLDMAVLNPILEEEDYVINCIDETIIATAFGQYKITKPLKQLGLIALKRQSLISKQYLEEGGIDWNKLYQIVEQEPTRPDAQGATTHLTQKYLQRLQIMEAYLEKFEEE